MWDSGVSQNWIYLRYWHFYRHKDDKPSNLACNLFVVNLCCVFSGLFSCSNDVQCSCLMIFMSRFSEHTSHGLWMADLHDYEQFLKCGSDIPFGSLCWSHCRVLAMICCGTIKEGGLFTKKHMNNQPNKTCSKSVGSWKQEKVISHKNQKHIRIFHVFFFKLPRFRESPKNPSVVGLRGRQIAWW